MRKQPKPERLWGITYANSQAVMPDTIRRTRQAAQKACCDARYQLRDNPDDWRKEWLRWNKHGCRAVRVTVQVEPPHDR